MKFLKLLILTFVALATILQSCKEDEPAPELKFKDGAGYIYNNYTILDYHRIKFGILASSPKSLLTNISIYSKSNGNTIVHLDSSLNCRSLNIEKYFFNTFGDTVQWIITTMDNNSKMASINLTTYDTTRFWDPIIYYPSVKLGMQNNDTINHFFDLKNGLIYHKDSALLAQGNINLLGYYTFNGVPCYTLSSPGEQQATLLYPSISNWSMRMLATYDVNTLVSVADFDASKNDSLMYASYHNTIANIRSTYPNLAPGQVIPFKTSADKLGLIKVISTQGENAGYIEVDVKYQN